MSGATELEPDGPGGTLLTFTDTIARIGKAARDGAGWHVCLDALGARLDGGPAPPSGERWREVHPGYVARLRADAPVEGPPPGMAAG